MYLIKDFRENYFDAEKVNSFEVHCYGCNDYNVVAVIIIGVDAVEKYIISSHNTEEAAREYLDALVKTIRINGTKR